MPDAAAPETSVAAVILAAGASQRLGEPKQLVSLHGESLIRRSARLAAESGCSPVLVVIGFEAPRMRNELEGSCVRLVENPEWPEGMGSSLRAGMAAAAELEPPPSAVLLLVCDQARLTAVHLRTLLASHRSGGLPITASVYGKQPGVPAIFASRLLPQLLAVSGDHGARDLIRSHRASVQEIPWPEGAYDLDTPADREQLA
jgi:molybdenum cofactor cytidylyltransferase